MRGQRVIARAFGGEPLVRLVWDVGDGVVYLASAAEFDKRQGGRAALEPIGFPLVDVFAYDEAFMSGPRDWRKLRQWRPMKLAVSS